MAHERFDAYWRTVCVVAGGIHAALCLVFGALEVFELAAFNVVSVALWREAWRLYRRGRATASMAVGVFEVIVHQVLAVYYVGTAVGLHYHLLVVPTLLWLASQLDRSVRLALVALSGAGLVLCLWLGNDAPVYELDPALSSIWLALNLGLVFFNLALGSHVYRTSADAFEADLIRARQRTEEQSRLLRTMFGRYLSVEVMSAMLEDPASLDLGGEQRRVTIMMTDLRGFTALSETLPPAELLIMLNEYFEVMIEIVLRHGGTINEIIGDALLVMFGAPRAMPDRVERAVACAIEMQNAMSAVNESNQAKGLPDLEMGIGINDCEVVVGNIGTANRSKYAAVGSGVNLTSRIESYTVGGQILVSESVRHALGDALQVDGFMEVYPKGSEAALKIHVIGGLAGDHQVYLESAELAMVPLQVPVAVAFKSVRGKDVGAESIAGQLVELSGRAAVLRSDRRLEMMSNIELSLRDVDERRARLSFYAKVLDASGPEGALLRFTAVPPQVDAYFEAACRFGASRPVALSPQALR